jgi:hypothetical protein
MLPALIDYLANRSDPVRDRSARHPMGALAGTAADPRLALLRLAGVKCCSRWRANCRRFPGLGDRRRAGRRPVSVTSCSTALFGPENPIDLDVWQGGKPFHGGMIGVILTLYFYSRSRNVPFFPMMDVVAAATDRPVLRRLANFNGELYGRATERPGPRSSERSEPDAAASGQLYEAALEQCLGGVVHGAAPMRA